MACCTGSTAAPFDLIPTPQVKEAHFRAYPHWKWCTKDRKKSPRKVSDRTESSDSMGMYLSNASFKNVSQCGGGLNWARVFEKYSNLLTLKFLNEFLNKF